MFTSKYKKYGKTFPLFDRKTSRKYPATKSFSAIFKQKGDK